MRIRFFKLLICLLCFSFSGKAQLYQALLDADSLSTENEFQSSIKLIQKVLDSNPRNFLKSQAFYQLSYNYLQLYDLEKATDYNQKSLDLRDLLHYEFIADNYMRFGTIELIKDKPETALDYFLEASELPHEDLQFSGILDGYLGATYERLGKPDLALEHLKTSLETLMWELEETHPNVSVANYNLGNLYASIGDYKNASKHYDASIYAELKSKWAKTANVRLAKSYNALGIASYKNRLISKEAIELFDAALLASKGNRRLTAASKINLAQIHFINRDFEKASPLINAALDELLHDTEEVDPQYFIPLIIDKDLYVNALQLKVEILLEEYFDDQKDVLLEQAFDQASRAVDVYEAKLFDFYTEGNQLQLLENSKDIYEQAIYISLKLYENTGNKKYIDQGFRVAERGKALILKNQLQQINSLMDKNLPESLRSEEEDLKRRMAFLETDIAIRYSAEDYRKEGLELQRDYRSFLQKIEKADPRYFNMRFGFPQITLSKLQDYLAADEAVLSYYQGKEMYYIFAINRTDSDVYFANQNVPLTQDSKKKFDLKDAKKKTKRKFPVPNQTKKSPQVKFPKPNVGIYTKYTDDDFDLKGGVDAGLRSMNKLSKKEFINSNYSLYRRLIEPIAPIIKKKKTLIVIPHGDLHFVSFESLIKSKPKKKPRYHKLKYLIKDHSITYEMSADFLLHQQKNSSTDISSIAAYAPVFNPEDQLGYTLRAEDFMIDSVYYEAMDLRSANPKNKNFKTLKYSEEEVLTILEEFANKKYKGKAFLKVDASEASFKQNAGDYNYLHLASHSFVNTKNPKLSGLALAPGNEEDGILYAGEIMNLNLQGTNLVVLSSCESGTGTLVRGEGLLSLNRAFRFAGVQNTISTRWKISDKASAKLMKYFYEKVLDGATYAEALQYAKLKMIKKSKTATPKLWAGFMLTGAIK